MKLILSALISSILLLGCETTEAPTRDVNAPIKIEPVCAFLGYDAQNYRDDEGNLQNRIGRVYLRCREGLDLRVMEHYGVAMDCDDLGVLPETEGVPLNECIAEFIEGQEFYLITEETLLGLINGLVEEGVLGWATID